MIIEGKSHDTLENVVYTLKKVKEREEREGVKRPWDIAFVSYPEHLNRFKDFEEEAVKKGLIGKNDFRFHKIRTFPKWKNRREQRHNEKEYESNPLRILTHKYKLMSIDRYKGKREDIINKKQDPFIKIFTEARDYLLRIRNSKK